MITRLQYVIMCRVEQGLPAFMRPLARKTHPNVLQRRRDALDDLFARGLIVRAQKNRSPTRRIIGPRLTREGRRVLNWIRNGKREQVGLHGIKGEPGYNASLARVFRIRQALESGEEIGSLYD